MTVKRPMLLLSAAIVAGMYLFALLNVEVSLMVLFLLFLATIVACIKNKKLYINLILIGAFFLLLISFFYYAWREDVSNRPLYHDFGKQSILTGEVLDKVEETERYVRFCINAETIEVYSSVLCSYCRFYLLYDCKIQQKRIFRYIILDFSSFVCVPTKSIICLFYCKGLLYKCRSR